MQEFNWQGFTISVWLMMIVIYVVWVTVALVLKNIIFRVVLRLARKSKTRVDDVLVRALNLPLTILIYVSGGVVVEHLTQASHFFPVIFKGAIIFSLVLFIDRFISGLVNRFSATIEILRSSESFARGFVHLVVYGIGVLVMLDNFGVSITPVIASLGIGSLAVALALQPTLENFFPGSRS